MATQSARIAPSDSSLPLYRMDLALYDQLVVAGALEGLDVELRDGVLVDGHSDGVFVDAHTRREDAIHRIDVGTYHRMVATGLLEGLPIELLEGLLVGVSPQGDEQVEMIRRLTRHLGSARAWLDVQLPLAVAGRSEPEPDLALTESRDPAIGHPRTALLAVEVAVTSHGKDRGEKLQLYAQAGIPTYWLVDVPGRAVEVRTDPGPGGYSHCEVYRVGTLVPSPAEGAPELDVAWLFDGLGD